MSAAEHEGGEDLEDEQAPANVANVIPKTHAARMDDRRCAGDTAAFYPDRRGGRLRRPPGRPSASAVPVAILAGVIFTQ